MSKERLEEIKDHFMEYEYDFALDSKDVKFLIEQAERAEQNKNDWLSAMKKLENYEKVASLKHEEIQRLREQNKRYREAYQYFKEAIETEKYVCHEKCHEVVGVPLIKELIAINKNKLEGEE